MKNKARENWTAGELLLDNELYNAAASRLYYSVLQSIIKYAQSCPNLKTELEKSSSKHTFARSIVKKTGKQSKYYSEVFDDLLDCRETADYEEGNITELQLMEIKKKAVKIKDFYIEKKPR